MKSESSFSLAKQVAPVCAITFRRTGLFVILSAIGLAVSLFGVSRAVRTHAQAKTRSGSPTRLSQNYGNIPLSFAASINPEQSGEKFVARGHGYALALTGNGSIMSLQNRSSSTDAEAKPRAQVVQMKLEGSRTNVSPQGIDELPGKINYLLGNDRQQWRTDINTFSKILYSNVYPGIDLVYYGNQRELEYDFRLAAGADPGRIHLRFTDGNRLRLSPGGDLVITNDEGEVQLKKPTSFQERSGVRETVASYYQITSRNEVTFNLGPYDRNLPLVIDPVLAYSTFLGGAFDDEAFGIAVDPAGNAYITGETLSPEFPATALQTTKSTGFDAFVTKLNPAGTAIVYSTFVGGLGFDRANAITLDATGNAYVTGQTFSPDFPLMNALHGTYSGNGDAMAFELNGSGTGFVYSTFLGGSSADAGNAIAVDQAGNTLVAGEADSRDFPVTSQTGKPGNELFRTLDGAGTWNVSDNGLNALSVSTIVFDPSNANTVYAGCDNGVFKSVDGGATWNLANRQLATPVQALAINPANTSIIYAGTPVGMYKSVDSGNTFTALATTPSSFRAVAIDPVAPANVYAVAGTSTFFRSTDSGATWTSIVISGITQTLSLAVDPNTPATIYTGTNRGVFKSTNGGVTWAASNAGFQFESVRVVLIDRTNSATVYFASNTGIYKSTNSGTSWTRINNNLGFSVSVVSLVLDPGNSNVMYAGLASLSGPIYKTVDGGNTWNTVVTGYTNTSVSFLTISPTNSSILLAGSTSGADGFVIKIAPGGATQVYSAYLGGSSGDFASGIAVDAAGRAYVTGQTASSDFPILNALQPTKGDPINSDAYLTIINGNGTLAYSSYLGGDNSDSGRSVALDSANNIYVAGNTFSILFPGAGGLQPTISGGTSSDIFVTKFNPSLSAILYTTSVGGSSTDSVFGLAVDSAGAAYLTGTTSSTDFPVMGAFQPTKDVSPDAFITKLAANGSISFSTFLGGANSDNGQGVALDAAGNVYVTGYTNSTNFRTVNPMSTYKGDFDVFVTKLIGAPDLVVTMTGSAGPINYGSQITYNITVANSGEAPAAGVQLTDTLLSGAGVVSINTNRGSCSGNRIVNCDLGTLNGGESAAITLVALPPAITPMTNTAAASTTTSESTTTNNTATLNTPIVFTDVMVKNTSALQLTEVGAVNTYIVSVTNKGPAAASTIIVSDNLPAELSFVSCASTAGACGGSGNNPTVTVNSLAVGASFNATIAARVNSGVAPGTIINNTVSMTSAVPDINPDNDAQTATTTVKAASGLGNANGIIAFDSNAGSQTSGTFDIYITNPDGVGLTDITYDNILDDQRPAWSPDGKKIVFTGTDTTADSGLWVMNADGTGKTQLTVSNNSNNDLDACWSPDGTRIVFNGSRPDLSPSGTLLIINADGTQLKSLGVTGGQPVWSPDGSRIAFGNGLGIGMMFADGSGKTNVTLPRVPVPGFSWSPDSTKLVISEPDGTSFGSSLYIVNFDGTGLTQINNTSGGRFPSWSPDGTRIAFSVNPNANGLAAGLYTINLDGTGLTKINGNLPAIGHVNWQRRPANFSPLPPTFNISGHISNAADGSAVTTVPISITGTQTRTIPIVITNGDYTVWGLPPGNYTLAPVFDFTAPNATSNPPNRVYNNLNSNQTNADFAITFGSQPPLTGFVKDPNGTALPNVAVAVRIFNQTIFSTDSNGFYTTGPLFIPGAGALVFPLAQGSYTNYVFDPGGLTVTPQHRDNNNFIARPRTASVSGTVRVGGVGKSGIQVSTGSPQFLTATTDANGNYTINGVGEGITCTIQADTATYPFTPPQTLTINGAKTGVDFDAPANQHLISGHVALNGPISGVTVTLSGGGSATTQTDSQGNFSFPLQAAGLEYTITLAKAGYTLTPSSVHTAVLFNNIVLSITGSPNFVQWDSLPAVTVAETDGKVALRVLRSTGLTQSMSVDYTTNDGTASQRSDYTAMSGTLTFAPQETQKTITIPISDDSLVEGDETFTVTLSNPVGAILGNVSTVTITIQDDDTATSVVNPVDSAGFYTQQQYFDFLSRVPDPSGLTFWTQNITDCGLDKSCVEVHRINASGAFFLSIEFQQTGYLVERIYKTAYGDAAGASTFSSAHQLSVPVVRLNEFLPDTQAIGQGVVVLQPGWEQVLETNKQNFANNFVQRTRFLADYPVNMSASDYVDKLNTRAGNPLSASERNQLVSDLSTNAKTRGQVLRAVAEHSNLVNAEFNRAFVLMQYFGYLRRNPNDAPDSDYTGYDFWLTKLNQFNGDYIGAEMVKAFIGSSEYRKRFGP